MAAASVTKQMIEDYATLNQERLELDRASRLLKQKLDQFEKTLLPFVRENGGKSRTLTKFGYILSIKMKPSSPSWKDEFLRVAGVDEAEEVARKAAENLRESFQLEKAS